MKRHRIQLLPQSYMTSLLLFTNILQSHGHIMTGALGLLLSAVVARIQGVGYFDNSVLTQVKKTAVFQSKTPKTKQKKNSPLWKGIFGEEALRAGTGYSIPPLLCSSS